MPASKKPRKRYHRKPVRTMAVSQADIDNLQAMLTDIALRSEIKLPRGNATYEDVKLINVLLNHAMTGVLSREWLDVTERDNACRMIDAGGEALRNMVKKAHQRARETGKAPRYVCTAAELNLIRDGVALARQFLSDSYEVAPNRTIREYYAMRTLIMQGRTENITPAKVERMLKNLAVSETENWWGDAR